MVSAILRRSGKSEIGSTTRPVRTNCTVFAPGSENSTDIDLRMLPLLVAGSKVTLTAAFSPGCSNFGATLVMRQLQPVLTC